MGNPVISNQSAKQREAAERTQGKDAAGNNYDLTFVGVSTATSAAAGSASALPSPPAGYFLAIGPSGAVVKIPFYN